VGLARQNAHRQSLLALVLLAVSGACFAAPSATDIFKLVNERLGFMKDVAMYKAKNGEPVEDKVREGVVIEKAKQKALKAGLDPASTEAFFRAQIAAAKAIQYRYLADWSFLPEPPDGPPRDLVGEVRPELLRLGGEIIEALQQYLANGGRFTAGQLAEFLATVKIANLNDQEKGKLFQSITEIKLSAP
jgi:chorismate mutase